ncbi:hypothetical protein GE061_006274 [Apolygus lucorum]|uniref:Peptidoglycan recognition protein family domain-containing protein n=1 Tax=Apolygus lucorum TaxID=248454 RepID=A0A6A4J2K8_APOLU|nr:hypothetical protein GE061_006274 [Apolygus lucorum]
MSSESDQHSDSSSSGGDEESDCTNDEIAVPHTSDPLSFNGIGTINMDNCQESHIGTRIIADNLNIILNLPKGVELAEKLADPSNMLQYEEDLDWEWKIGSNRSAKNVVTDKNMENPTFSWSYRNKRNPFSYVTCSKKVCMILLGILILVIMVVIMGISFGRKSSKGGGNDVTTVSPSITSSATITSITTLISPTTTMRLTTTTKPETLTWPATLTWPPTITWPTTTTPPTTVTWPETTRPMTKPWPTDDGHTSRTTSTTPQPVDGEFISRKSWGGRDPPDASSRNNFNPIEFIALDNLPGERCSSVRTCSDTLQKIEETEDGPLNYNFLIDDVGNFYEARGWDHMSDYTTSSANPSTTMKVAFIGDYTESHLTAEQISSFRQKIQLNYTEVIPIVRVEAQCCRGVPHETGPDPNVICDLENAMQHTIPKHCSPCRWSPGQLECN